MARHAGTQEPIVLEMKTWAQRNCWARRPRHGKGGWHAGTPGHCGTWYNRTPWGAMWASWRLHALTRPLVLIRRRLLASSLGLTAAAVAFMVSIALDSSGDTRALAIFGALATMGSMVLQALAASRRAR